MWNAQAVGDGMIEPRSGHIAPVPTSVTTTAAPIDASLQAYSRVRDTTERLAAPLSPEDQTVQSMPDVSPTKWHRAHTTWFFEEFLLQPFVAGDRVYHPQFSYLFNSYYEAVGERYPRAERGHVSRPGVGEIAAYRSDVDERMAAWLERGVDEAAAPLVVLGLHHEQQHQELLLMDVKHVLSCSPLDPAYRPSTDVLLPDPPSPRRWLSHEGGLVDIGHRGAGFAFDNESPRHGVYLRPFELASKTVTCGEWLEFMADGGYRRPELWLSDGWATVNANRWDSPLYWREVEGEWTVFTLSGRKPVERDEPVCHVSYYEADAFAHWAGSRLPTEAEWEAIAVDQPVAGNFADLERFHPRPVARDATQLFGDVWEWTASPYSPYPGFRPAPGAVGEYNGKFMVNQHVLRGGCCVTPAGHTRATYRNFFPPSARWAFSGVRLARDL